MDLATDQFQDTRLSDLGDQQRATVLSLDESQGHEVHQRLLALGVYPGASLQLLRRAPLGDPIQVRVESSLLSLRKAEASAIRVVPC